MAAYRLKQAINGLYSGRSQRATKFRYGLIAFDLATIAFLVATAPDFPTPFIVTVDFILGLIILADFLARLWLAPDKPPLLRPEERRGGKKCVRTFTSRGPRYT